MKKSRTPVFGLLLATLACGEQPSPAEPTAELSPLYAVQGETDRLPFWERGPVCCIDDHVVVYFYVTDPSVIPDDFNLLGFQFDPRALGAEFAVTGFNLRNDSSDPAPRKTHLRGTAPVPFWFIPRAVFEEVADDGFVSVSELESEGVVVRGYADRFQEELHPSPPANTPHLSMTAKGPLADGGSFHARITLTKAKLDVAGRLNR